MIGRRHLFSVLIAISIFFGGVSAEDNKIKRVPYNIPLIKLSLMNKGKCVRVFKSNSRDYALICLTDDQFIKRNRDKVFKTTFKEYKHHAHRLSSFEVKYIRLASRSLENTLEDLNHHLQKKRWGECVYLDGFLPKYLKNYYMLLAIARNDPEKYRWKIKLFEDKYEVSLNSSLSDQRINMLINDEVWLMKLRIVSKELAHQLRLWQKRDLNKKNRNPEVVLCSKVEEYLDLFVRIYFGIKSPKTKH